MMQTPNRTSTDRTRALLLTSALVALAALVGCGAGAPDDGAAEIGDTATAGPPPVLRAGPEVAADDPGTPDDDRGGTDQDPARVARVVDHLDDLDVYDGPGSGTVTHTLGATTAFGSTTVLLVVDESDDRVEVLLPVRPNGTTGWIDASEVEFAEVELHVNVDLEAREMTVWDAGEEVLTTTVAIGDPDHPTPTGTFSITDKLDTGDPDGPYGPYAIGLSARSDVLTEFAGGDGQVGIHGTDDPSSIGEPVSHGCIRVPNEVVSQLAALLPLGTPVTVS